MSFVKQTLFIGALAITGMANSAQAAEEHAGHTMANMDMSTPATQSEKTTNSTDKQWSMADKYYGEEAMAKARALEIATLGGGKNSLILVDRLEAQITNGENALVWDAQGWYGTDENKLWIKTEGEYGFGANEIEDAEIQALWSKPISAFWDVQAGVRQDFKPQSRTHLVMGVQGLAPYWFEVDAAAFLSDKGDLTSRVEAEYEMFITQRLVLQPRGEIELSAQDIPELNVGAGFTNLSLGLRMRYDIKREFAPFIGLQWQSSLGETAQRVRASGSKPEKTAVLLGIRAWY